MVNISLFAVAAVLYAGATFSYHAAWLGGRRRFRWLATVLLSAAVTVQGVGIGVRWVESGRPPLASGFEGFSFYGWALAAAYLLLLERRGERPGLGAMVTPIALIAVVIAAILPKRIEPLLPVLRSSWLGIHVSVSFMAYVAFTLAFAAAIAYLRQDHVLKRRQGLGWGAEMPSLLALERLGSRASVVGFALMCGSLVTGSLWARRAWGVPWVWQPQQIGALATWIVYAGYLVCWRALRWRGPRLAWWLVAGFVAVIVTFVGADLLLPGSLHNFLLIGGQ